jgi:hypothetical protein
MSGAKDTVNMDDRNMRGLNVQHIWLDHPTAHILVRFSVHEGIPLNKRAWILFTFI